MRKTLLWDFKIANFGNSVASNFGSLAMCAGPGPTGGVSSDGWPYKFVSEHLAGTVNSRVSQAVNAVEDLSSPRKGNERTWRTVGDINNEIFVPDVDFPE